MLPRLPLALASIAIAALSIYSYTRSRSRGPSAPPSAPSAAELVHHRFHSFSRLRNRYLIVRHAESTANRSGIIASDPEQNRSAFGLTDSGKTQVIASLPVVHSLLSPSEPVHIVSSPFLRAYETAALLHSHLGHSKPIEIRDELCERRFGTLDGKSNKYYDSVWTRDLIDSSHKEFQVESVCEVLSRATGLIAEFESRFDGYTIVLVSHGDTLQILQSAFEGLAPRFHHANIPLLKNAEVRLLTWRKAENDVQAKKAE